MRTAVALLAMAGIAYAQAPENAKDPLGRTSPQDSILRFIEACHTRDYGHAAYYLDLRKMQPMDRIKNGQDLARQLEDLLDDTTFDIATLSRDPEGDQSDDLAPALEHLYTVRVDGSAIDLEMERVVLRNGLKVWQVSSASVERIPEAHKAVAESPFEKNLPQQLVTFEVLDTPVWRWIALLLMGVLLWFASKALMAAVTHPLGGTVVLPVLRGPVRAAVALGAFRAAIELAPPSALPRLFLERGVALGMALAGAWTCAVIVDIVSERWHARLDPRVQAVSFSVLPLGRQMLKLALYLIALLAVFSAWGYNTSAILAGLGVGGLAVALAAQKTLENLFGGVSVIGDRPVLVGDVCRFGDRVGTVMHIGLRSTRIRTPDRTVISIPNGQFAGMTLENVSVRDKILFRHTLKLRRDTSARQLEQVLQAFRQVLAEHTQVETGKVPVRLSCVGDYSLDIEVFAYVTTSVFDDFLMVQQDLLLKLLHAVEAAGARLSVPLQEAVVPETEPPRRPSE